MNFGLVTNFFRNELLLTLFEMSNFPQKIQFFLKLYYETCLNFCAKIQRYYTVFHPEMCEKFEFSRQKSRFNTKSMFKKFQKFQKNFNFDQFSRENS